MFAQMFGSSFSPLSLAPVAWYKADGNALDANKNKPGAWTGPEAYATGINNQAFNFSLNSIVQCGTNLGATTEFTICAWVKPLTYSGVTSPRIAGVDDNKWILYVNAGNLAFYGSNVDAAFSPAVSLPTNEWVHVVVTFNNANNIKAYKNGVYISAQNRVSNLSAQTTSPFCIGNRPVLNRQFLGAIDDVIVFNRELTQDEITKVYNWRQ